MRILFLVMFIHCKLFSQNALPILLKGNFHSGASTSRIEILPNKDTIMISQFSYAGGGTGSLQIIEKLYKGTPIYRNGWFENETIYLDGKGIKGNVAYNLENSEIQFADQNIAKAIIIKPDSFTINHKWFVQIRKKIKTSFDGYFEPILSGKTYSLYKSHQCNYRPKVQGQRTGYEVSAEEYEGIYVKSTSYFMQNGNDFFEIKLNKSGFKKFGDYADQMENFAKANKYDIKKESDLIEIIKYYGSKL